MRRSLHVVLLAAGMAAPVGPAVAGQQDSQPAPPPRAVERQSAPVRSGGSVERAVPRSAPAGRVEAPRASSADSSRSRSGDQPRQRATPPPDRRSGGGDRAVPRSGRSDDDRRSGTPGRAVERDRGGRQSYGTAVARRYPPRAPYRGYVPRGGWYYPYYPLSYGFFWDPWWGYGSPYGGYGYGAGYGYGRGYGYGGGYGYGVYSGPAYQVYGGLRLKVKPREAEVFVDGYYAGTVDDFDGAFQQLNLDVGPHRIEVRLAGYEPVSFEIRTQPGEKITYKGELKPVP